LALTRGCGLFVPALDRNSPGFGDRRESRRGVGDQRPRDLSHQLLLQCAFNEVLDRRLAVDAG
jgi:hypothetical protein